MCILQSVHFTKLSVLLHYESYQMCLVVVCNELLVRGITADKYMWVCMNSKYSDTKKVDIITKTKKYTKTEQRKDTKWVRERYGRGRAERDVKYWKTLLRLQLPVRGTSHRQKHCFGKEKVLQLSQCVLQYLFILKSELKSLR